MDEMWKVQGRIKPVPLEYDAIMTDNFPMPHSGSLVDSTQKRTNGSMTVTTPEAASGKKSAEPSTATLKDQRELTLKDNLELFVDAYARPMPRLFARAEVLCLTARNALLLEPSRSQGSRSRSTRMTTIPSTSS